MSIWTHVNGAIRIDSTAFLFGSNDKVQQELENILGKPLTYSDMENAGFGEEIFTKLPLGSEGSLEYEIRKTNSTYNICWGYVYFWGDLRDYDDIQELTDWFLSICTKICDNKLTSVRQAAMECYIEGRGFHVSSFLTDSKGNGSLGTSWTKTFATIASSKDSK